MSNPLITEKNIIINNITNYEEFLVLKKEFSDYFNFYDSINYLDEINEVFNVKLNVNDPSYFYSVQHYVNMLVNKKNSFSFYVGPDCKIISNDLTDYLEKSMELINLDETIISTTIPWTTPEISDSVGIHEQGDIEKKYDEFYLSKVFSDQVYFVNTERIKNSDLTITAQLHPFPQYGINGFEFRLTNDFILNDKYRAIYKDNSYYSHNSF
jgi:hypothetical protein